MDASPTVSVILPTLNGEPWLEKLFAMLGKQSLPVGEVLVLDSESEDNTREIAHKHGAEIQIVPRKKFDHGGTRTMAARMAGGEILVFMTQDAILAGPKALERLIRAFADRRVGAAYGRQLPSPGATPFAAHLRLFNYPGVSQIRCWQDRKQYGFRTIFISNSFAAYRRRVLAEIDYFAERQLFGEDTLAVAKILEKGYCVAYVGEACVYHSHNYTFMQDCRRYFDIGAFHALHPDLVARFGGTGGAGREFVLSEMRYLARRRLFHCLPLSLARNIGKFLAYNLGRSHARLPGRWVRCLSMSPHWWG